MVRYKTGYNRRLATWPCRLKNMSAANSRIRDVDVAEETAELTKNNILQNAGISVLAQANQSSQSALTLLKTNF